MPGCNRISGEPVQQPAAWCGVWLMTLAIGGLTRADEPVEALDAAFLHYLASYEDQSGNWTDVAVADADHSEQSAEATAREAVDEEP